MLPSPKPCPQRGETLSKLPNIYTSCRSGQALLHIVYLLLPNIYTSCRSGQALLHIVYLFLCRLDSLRRPSFLCHVIKERLLPDLS